MRTIARIASANTLPAKPARRADGAAPALAELETTDEVARRLCQRLACGDCRERQQLLDDIAPIVALLLDEDGEAFDLAPLEEWRRRYRKILVARLAAVASSAEVQP